MVKKVRTASLKSANSAVSGGKKVNHTISAPSNTVSAQTAFPIPVWEAAYDKLYPYYIEMYQRLDADLKRLKDTVNDLD